MARYLRIETCDECPHLTGPHYNRPHWTCARAPSGHAEMHPQPPIPEWCPLERVPVAPEKKEGEANDRAGINKQDDTVVYIGARDDQIKGYNYDDPRGLLVEGQAYAVAHREVHAWHTRLRLMEHPRLWFNSVCFRRKS